MKRPERGWMPLSLLFVLVAGVMPALAGQPEPLTVVTWGGAYEQSQKEAFFDPFTKKTGIPVETVRFDGGLEALRNHLAQGSVTWDIVDMIRSDARSACEAGLLERIDPAILVPAPDGTPPEQDFIEGAINPCSITQLVFSTVIAYDNRAFPGEKPQSIADFFDLERFPGGRALRKAPVGLFEWALLSYGVPVEQLYDLLSTRRGFELAFRRLDRIRPELVWWTGGEEPVELLTSGQVTMASGYNGRFFHARAEEGKPISVIWDAQLLDFNSWTVPRGTDQPEEARQFIRFATRTERMADQSSRISYGPTRHSARRHVGLHTRTGVPMRPHLPTAPRHMDNAILRDQAWYTRTRRLRQSLFEKWLASPVDQP